MDESVNLFLHNSLAGISGYNGIEVIYLLGMVFAFPTI